MPDDRSNVIHLTPRQARDLPPLHPPPRAPLCVVARPGLVTLIVDGASCDWDPQQARDVALLILAAAGDAQVRGEP